VVYIQVEHPVTESIAEVNLPAAQVAVGMGIPLWQVPGNNIIIVVIFLVSLPCYFVSNHLLVQRSDVSTEWTMEEAMTFGGKHQLLLLHSTLMK
jgi:hypothetical protein